MSMKNYENGTNLESRKKKSSIKIAVISVAVVAAVILILAGSLFAYVNINASQKAVYNREACIEAAKQSVIEKSDSADGLFVTGVDRELVFEYGKLSSGIYTYEIEIRSGYLEYDVIVDSVSGKATIVDIGD